MITRKAAVAALAHYRVANVVSRLAFLPAPEAPQDATVYLASLTFEDQVAMLAEVREFAAPIFEDVVASHERMALRMGGEK